MAKRDVNNWMFCPSLPSHNSEMGVGLTRFELLPDADFFLQCEELVSGLNFSSDGGRHTAWTRDVESEREAVPPVRISRLSSNKGA